MEDIDLPQRRLSRVRKSLWFMAAITALLLVVGYLWRSAQPSSQPAGSYASAFGGPFTMTDQTGRTVTEQTLRGKPYAIFFGFTRCPDVCPTSLNRMALLRKQLGADGDKFNIIFVSVDPVHDTRAGIGHYLTLFGTPIIGLTGTAAQLAQIVKAFHIYYEKVPVEGGDYTIDHSATIFLIDADGQFVTTISHQEDQKVALQKLKRLIA
ncbi:SCO family protein [Sphingomonadaceae bacterium G21617-S1]|jgi:protein SCO1|uniref:SCO family protein n=1 Tax=Rhizorhabdus sp. TaxID=1968843 RepID=UPI00199F8816|nr:SCO family protein [Rhizorhabdus sp.]MBD3761199.1 SCO family protein [Rhizorhabdus sp.]MCZ4340276.1 SCO family protein [Sphingomonadaceae bacterium G21617-S1]